MPFAIGEAERDAWMLCMRQAMNELTIDDTLLADHLLQSLARVADHMRNQ
jgi:hemoglobin